MAREIEESRAGRWTPPRFSALVGGFLTAGIMVVGLLFAFVMAPISRSYPGTPDRVGALVVLAGGNGDRLDHALDLAEQGVSDVLILNTGIDWVGPSADDVRALCANDSAVYTVYCVSALPDSTKGEAQTVGKLASDLGIDTLGIVTAEFHMHRALRWFDRCSDAEFTAAAVPDTSRGPTNPGEFVSSAHALLIDRSCSPG